MSEEMNNNSGDLATDLPNNHRPSKKKNPILFVLLGVFLFVGIFIINVYMSIPRDEIELLKTGYVEINLKAKAGPERFSITKNKPKNWKFLKEIPETVIDPIVISEDWAFYQHEGVDYSQIKKAIEDNIVEGKKLRGASTISQQLVKNLFFDNERSFIRKIKEVVYVSHLESELSKDKILEVYLNILHLGKDVYGVQTGSQYYFSKNVGSLNYKEGAFLAMLLPNPVKYGESFRKKELSPYAQETIDKTLKKLKLAKKIDDGQFEKEMNRNYRWEKAKSKAKNIKDNNLDKYEEKNVKRVAKIKRKKFTDGSEYEQAMKNDPDVMVDDNLTYDDDALIEDNSGFESEFNVE